MFEARLKKVKPFKELIEVNLELFSQLTFMCDHEGICSQKMDTAQVTLMEFVLPVKVFESYKCEGAVDIGVNLRQLRKILKQIHDDRVLTLRYVDNRRDTLILLSEDSQTKNVIEYELKLRPVEDDSRFGVPDGTDQCLIEVPSPLFRHILRDLTSWQGKMYEVWVTNTNAVCFSVLDDKYTCSKLHRSSATTPTPPPPPTTTTTTTDTEEDKITIQMRSPVKQYYSARFLHHYSQASKLSSHVKLSVGDGIPLRIDYKIFGDLGRMSCFIAPLMEDDEEMAATRNHFETRMAERKDVILEARLHWTEGVVHLMDVLDGGEFRGGHMECDIEDGLVFKWFDCSTHAHVEVSLSAGNFDEFHCSGFASRGVDLYHFRRALKQSEGCSSIVILWEKQTDLLIVRSESQLLDTECELRYDINNPDECIYGNLKGSCSCTATMSLPSLKEIIRHFKVEGTIFLNISVTPEGILFHEWTETEESGSSYYRFLGKSEAIVLVRESIRMQVNLSSLEFLLKRASTGPTVKISASPDEPLEVKLTLLRLGTVTYNVSPFSVVILDKARDARIFSIISDLSKKEPSAEVAKKEKKGPKVATKRKPNEKKRPRKKPKPSTRPKKCHDCGQIKGYEKYLYKDLLKTKTATCINCIIAKCRNKMAEKAEYARHTGVMSLVNRREENRRLHVLGCERYECPIFFMDKKINMDAKLQASFLQDRPDTERLCGNYDILYMYSHCEALDYSPYTQRTTKGKLTIEAKKSAKGIKLLRGSVEMEPSLSCFTVPYGGNYTFEQKTTADSCTNSFELPFKVVDFPDEHWAEELSARGQTSAGTIRVLSKRTATGWSPNENPFRFTPVVTFDSVDEADTLVRGWKSTFLDNSWLYKHTCLPKELVWRIHEYVAFRPAPAFFFEKNDLWIKTSWCTREGSATETILVARRAQQS